MRLLLLAVFILATITYFADASPVASKAVVEPIPTQLTVDNSLVPKLSAKAYGVFDIETGEMLLSQNKDEVLPIASITKLFTAAKVLETESVEGPLRITAADVATEGRAGKLEVGQEFEPYELLFPLLLESSNDAAAALEHVIGEIGVAGETFVDGSGLSAQNRASVSELAGGVRELYLTEPHLFDVTTLKQYVGKYTGWVNNSPVRDLPGYKGGKHGYTEAAGRTLSAVFSEASLGGRELGYIILGSENIKTDTVSLRTAVEQSVHLE